MFNVSVLSFLRQNGALPTSLVSSAVVPLTVLAFTLDLPLLGPSPPLGTLFLLGTGFLVVGLGLYNSTPKTQGSAPAAGRQ